jgi:hypothetical protein
MLKNKVILLKIVYKILILSYYLWSYELLIDIYFLKKILNILLIIYMLINN